MELKELRDNVLKCHRCDLVKTKKKYVFGEGNSNADIMFIGEAPGASEDMDGIPFVGRAGKILDELLASVNIGRDSIFICNILKCRPPGNRNPTPHEIEACTPFLNAQIELIKPKIICPLGNFATAYILRRYNMKDKIDGISRLHGKQFKFTGLYGSIEIIPLYHPAVATYSPEMKNVLLKDFKILEGRNG